MALLKKKVSMKYFLAFALGPIFSSLAAHLFSSDWKMTLAVFIAVCLGNYLAYLGLMKK